MKVVVTDYSFDSLDIENQLITTAGHQLVGRRSSDPAELADLVADADAVITQFSAVNAAAIGAMRQARVIVRYGIGVDNVDLDAARSQNIPVCNVPAYCIDEVADHTLALILALTRQVVTCSVHLRAGHWGGAAQLTQLHSLKHLTVGIVAFGRIGREVAARLQAFKCQILVHDPAVPAADIQRAGFESVSLARLLEQSDIVTLHCPSTASTRKLIDGAALRRMKPGALLINVARGDVVDTAELVAALESGRLGGVGLDVCDPEPIPLDSPLRRLPNVIATPHIASASVPAVTTLRTEVARTALAALAGEKLPNVVNGVRS